MLFRSDTLELSRRLATIHCDLDLPLAVDDLARRAPDEGALREWYRKLDFRNQLRQLGGDDAATDTPGSPASAAPAPTTSAQATTGHAAAELPLVPPSVANAGRSYDVIVDRAGLERWLAKLRAAELFAFDTETTSLDYLQAQKIGRAHV